MRGKLAWERAFLAALCIVVVTNKVFSPQYLIWVLPFAALIDGFDVLWLAVCVLTSLDFPVFYHIYGLCMPADKVVYPPIFLASLAVRNGLLLIITGRAMGLIPWRRAETTSNAAESVMPSAAAPDAPQQI